MPVTLRLGLLTLIAGSALGQIVNPGGGGGGGGAVSSVNGQTGTVVIPAAVSPAICHGYGTSVGAGAFNTPSTLNYFDVFASTYIPGCTHDNQSVASYSVQDSITKVYGTTFALTDATVIEQASNDTFPTEYPMVNEVDNYVDGLGAMMVYAALADATPSSGYAAKIKGTALSCTGSGFTTTDQYAIGRKTTHAGDTCTWSFAGNVFYAGTSTSTGGGQAFTVTFDGGTAQSYGVYGNTSGNNPYRVVYAAHAGTVGYDPFLVRVPLLSGRNQQHTVVWTCTTAPCYLDWMGSNGALQGPRVLMPLFWQNGNYGSQAQGANAAANQNVMAQYLVDQLSEDGLAVANADASGYVNYYGNSAGWANTLHPNNAGSALIAKALGDRWNQAVLPKPNPLNDHKIYSYSFSYSNLTGYGSSGLANGTVTAPWPIKIEQIDALVSGTFHTCSGTATAEGLVLFNNQTYQTETYRPNFITALGYNTTGPLFNYHMSAFGEQQIFALQTSTCSGTPTNGSESIVFTVYYSRL